MFVKGRLDKKEKSGVYMCAAEHNSTMRKKEVLPSVTPWLDVEGIK